MRRETHALAYAATRTHDYRATWRGWGRVTLGFGHDGGPRVWLAFDMPGNSFSGTVRKAYHYDVPHLSFGRAYRLRRLGGLKAWRIQSAIFHRLTRG